MDMYDRITGTTGDFMTGHVNIIKMAFLCTFKKKNAFKWDVNYILQQKTLDFMYFRFF